MSLRRLHKDTVLKQKAIAGPRAGSAGTSGPGPSPAAHARGAGRTRQRASRSHRHGQSRRPWTEKKIHSL